MLALKAILLGIPLLSLGWWVWADRRLRALRAGRGWRIGLAAAMLVLVGAFVWVIAARRDWVAASIPLPLYAVALLWGILFLPLTAVPMMVGWSLWSLGRFFVRKRPPAPGLPRVAGGPAWTRREWLGAAALNLPVFSTFGTALYGLSRMSCLRVRELTVVLDSLPPALDGLRIAHVTDTHVGKFTRGEMLDSIVATTNRLRADLVLFTGDLIDSSLRDLPVAAAMLRRMEAGGGLFMVEGNHDLFGDPDEFRRGVREAGLPFLWNEAATVRIRGAAVQLLGIAWHRHDRGLARLVDTVVAARDPEAFPILLAHHPHAFDRAVERGLPLTLSGHTHGGQLMVTPEFGAGPMLFRYWSGLYQRNGCALVVGNGTGNWFPLRTNAPAEIIHLTLRRG